MACEAVVTVRLVRSFEHRNFKPAVYRGVNLDQTVEEFINHVKTDVATRAGLPPPFRKFGYDTMKIIHQAHGAKTNELVMSLEDDDTLILQLGQTLAAAGVGQLLGLLYGCSQLSRGPLINQLHERLARKLKDMQTYRDSSY